MQQLSIQNGGDFMKDFNQFMSSVDQDKIMAMVYQNIDEHENHTAMITSALSKFMVKLLRQYHEWLMKELD